MTSQLLFGPHVPHSFLPEPHGPRCYNAVITLCYMDFTKQANTLMFPCLLQHIQEVSHHGIPSQESCQRIRNGKCTLCEPHDDQGANFRGTNTLLQ